jgi:AcrR family transcriptional regulator
MRRHRAAPATKRSASASKKNARWNGSPSLKGQRQEVILRSVANVLRNSRTSSLSIQDVADELGMTKGNLYYYFKDKQDILYQCHMRSMAISLRALEEARTIGRTPSESLRILLTGHMRGILDDGFGSILQTDLEHFRPDQRKTYIKKRDELERSVRSMIEDGVRLGEFECANVKLVGFAILGAINWIPKWYRSTGTFSSETIVEEMVNYFLRGLQRQPEAAQKRTLRRNGNKDDISKHKQAISTLEDWQ